MPKVATTKEERAMWKARRDQVAADPFSAIREIEKLESQVTRLKRDLERCELEYFLWLPGCRIKDRDERIKVREAFKIAMFDNHIPCNWEEFDGVVIRKKDAEKVISICHRLDKDYHQYKDND